MSFADTAEGFWQWYKTQIASVLPTRWTRPGERGDFLLLMPLRDTSGLLDDATDTEPLGAVLAVTRWQAGTPIDVGHVEIDERGATRLKQLARVIRRNGRRNLPIAIGIAPADLLETELRLPLAAERSLASVMAFEIGRVTPFSADALFWSCTVTKRIAAHQRLMVQLRCTPRAPLSGLASWLSRHGLAARELVAAIPDTTPTNWSAIALEKHEARARHRRLPVLLALVFVALGLGLTLRQNAERHALDAQMDTLRPAITHAQALRAQYEILTGNPAILARQAAQTGSVVVAMDALSSVLPDQAYLTELSIHAREVEFSGRAPSAAALLETIARDGQFHDPSLSGAVTRSDNAKSDVFMIRTRFVDVPAHRSAGAPAR